MSLKLEIPSFLLNQYQIGEYLYSAPFNLYKNRFVEGYIVVDEHFIYVFMQNKLHKKYALSDIESVKCETLQTSAYIYIVKKNKKEIKIISFSKEYLATLSSIALGIDIYLKEKIFFESKQKPTHCPKCHLPYKNGSQTCFHCSKKSVGIQKILKYIGPYQYKLFFNYFLTLLPVFVSLLNPWIYQKLIDDFIYQKHYDSLFLLFILFLVGLYLLSAITGYFMNRLSAVISNGMVHDMRVDLYAKVQKLSLSSANSKTTGGLINNLSSDTVEIQDFLTNTAPNLIIQSFTAIFAMIIMLITDSLFALLILLPMPFVFYIHKAIFKKINAKYRLNWKFMRKSYDTLHDIIGGIKVVKTFSKETKEIDRFRNVSVELRDNTQRADVFWGLLMPITWFVVACITGIAIYYLGNKVLHHTMSIGEMTKWITYVNMLYGTLNYFLYVPRSYLRFSISCERVSEILNEPIAEEQEKENSDIHGDIEFENVRFGYISYAPVLKNISFSVKTGETIGIVGHSGSGKSTLVNLLMKLYDADSGKIRIDGKNIQDYNPILYRKQLGVVLQETFLFKASIFENIRYGNENATYEEVIAAAKEAKIHDAILKKELAYDTQLGSRGEGLSGGEKQRIAIARAILNRPKIFILDEATSSLDTVTEQEIHDSLREITKGKTTFMIAHRLSTLKNADRLIVLEQGNLVEIGTHKELLAKKGYYYQLVDAQYMTYQKKVEEVEEF